MSIKQVVPYTFIHLFTGISHYAYLMKSKNIGTILPCQKYICDVKLVPYSFNILVTLQRDGDRCHNITIAVMDWIYCTGLDGNWCTICKRRRIFERFLRWGKLGMIAQTRTLFPSYACMLQMTVPRQVWRMLEFWLGLFIKVFASAHFSAELFKPCSWKPEHTKTDTCTSAAVIMNDPERLSEVTVFRSFCTRCGAKCFPASKKRPPWL